MRKIINTKLIISLLILTLIGSLFMGCTNIISKSISIKNNKASSTPQNLIVPTMAYDDNSITLAWHKPDSYKSITNYNIYMNGKCIGNTNNNTSSKSRSLIYNFYKDTSNSSAVKISQHTYTVAGLNPNTTYKFTVRSVDNKGTESKDSNTIVETTTEVPKIFDVTKYGAIGDGQVLDTKHIQAAIDDSTSGSEVLLPSGKTFKSGALWLKPGIIFKVDGSLIGSDNPEDYIKTNDTSKDANKNNALINAVGTNNSKDLKIIGSGVINGNGWKYGNADALTGFPNSLKSNLKTVSGNGILAANQFKLAKNIGLSDTKAYSMRSNLISINHIDNVYLGDGLSFENPSQHTIVTSHCNNTVLNGAIIKTFDCNNADGIDFDSNGLTILNSVFDTGDDDINFTAGKGAEDEKTRKPVDNVWIFDNYFAHGHGAVVAGSNTASWIENILAEDNVLNGTGAGLRCKTTPQTGGGAKNITFRDSALKNITDGEGEPFTFTSNYSDSNKPQSFKPALTLPQFKDISVINCSVDGSKGNAIFISGLKDSYDDNINFTDISFKNTESARINYLKDSTFKNVTFDPNVKNAWITGDSKNLAFKN